MSYGRPQQSKAQNDANAKTLRALVKHPDNKTCADCKRNDPRWASWNIGCYLCIRCSGIHRSMGTHISKVKSIDLDIWTPEQMEAIQKWGNRRCNLYWEAHLKPGHVPPDHKIESFIRSKYELRRWAREGPVPDPATLDPAPSEPQAAATAPTAGTSTASSRNTAPPAAQPSNGGGGILDLLDDPVPSAAAAGAPKPSASAVATKSPVAPAQTSSGSGLFDLDWSSAPTTASAGGGGAAATTTTTSPTPAGGPKGKDDILSLFSAPRPSIPSAGGAASASGAGAGAGGFGALNASFGGLNMGGGASNGASAAPAAGGLAGLDASNPWGAPAGGANAQRSNSLFDSQDVWGAAKPAAGAGAGGGGFGDIWGSSGSASQTGTTSTTTGAAAAKKDDAFADIWGDFK
ncbi:hypothetical protein CF326_g277 [Tilletia indica]|nr:hypothetical protein CF326_g277 [Tilletia indica]